MIDFDKMEVGDAARMPHPTIWGSANREEYNRAQECTTRTGKLFSVETEFNAGGQITGFTITRTK